MAEYTTPAARLRAAINESPYSIRSLAKALASKPGVSSTEDSIRRTLTKKLSGKEAMGEWAALLEAELSLPDGHLHEANYSHVLSLSQQMIRRLDAGETLPAETLIQLAEATEEAALVVVRFAARLRQEAQAQQKNG